MVSSFWREVEKQGSSYTGVTEGESIAPRDSVAGRQTVDVGRKVVIVNVLILL